MSDSKLPILCDLILLSWNHLEQTQPCLESLFQCTDVPSRLFIVDNGSEPAIRAFLQGVRPRGMVQEVVCFQHETNEGFPRGMNRGIRASSAPFVCLLNNDLLFTRGWLQELIGIANANPAIGVVNPTSNTLGNIPPKGQSLKGYAESLKSFHDRYTEVGMCIGFCMLVKRELLDRIGGLSEEVERIFFEDEDFSLRAQQAGFRCVVAAGSYVFHAEHQTVRKMPEREALFSRNRRWCEAKWGRPLRMAWPRFTPVAPASEDLRQWLERLMTWARRRTYLYVYCPLPTETTLEDLFRSVNLIPHADIHWDRLPRSCPQLVATSLILRRRKKPFDVIAAPTYHWGQWMHRLRWLHRADVLPQDDEAQLTLQWRQKSHSPLSS